MKDIELLMRAITLLKEKGNLVDTITQLLEEGAELGNIKKALEFMTTGYKKKEIADCCKTFVTAKTKTKGNGDEYSDWLVEGERTEQEAYDFIIAQGIRLSSLNILAHMNNSLSRWSLCDRVRGNSGEITKKGINRKQAQEIMDNYVAPLEEEEETINENQQAWDHMFAEMAKPAKERNRNSLHPDKVSHLGDEDLTKAYTESFKATPKARKSRKQSA